MRALNTSLSIMVGLVLGVAPAASASELPDLPQLSLQSALIAVAQSDDDESVDEDEASDDDDAFDEEEALLDEEEAAPDEAPAAGAPDSEEPETAAQDVQGGATGFVFPTGFYMSSDLGGFMRFGGYGDSRDGNGCFRCVPKLYTNPQPWIGINIGYDIIKNFGVEMTLGTGFISDAAPVGYYVGTEAEPAGVRDSPENSAVTMMNLAVTGSWYFLDRLAIQGKGFVGGVMLSPDPDPSRLNLVRSLTCEAGGWGDPSPQPDCGGEFGADFGMVLGAGMGLRYATLLTNLVIGFDVNTYAVISPNVKTAHTGGIRFGSGDSVTYIPPPFGFSPIPVIPALSFAPVIKYVF